MLQLPFQNILHLSILNPALRGYACIKSVFDGAHFGNGVGHVDNFLRAAAACEADVYVFRAVLQGFEHVLQIKPAVDKRVGDFVAYD